MSYQKSANTDLRGMRILCIALMVGLILFAGIVLSLIYFDPMTTTTTLGEYENIFLGVGTLAALLAFVMARFSFSKKMEAIKNSSVNITDKLNLYRTALILYMAPCEGAGLFSIMLFMLTGNYWLLLVTLGMLLAMFTQFPTKQKLIDNMSLDWKEQQSLE